MATETVSKAGSSLVFNNTYTASCSQEYIKCIVAAENDFQGLFSNSDTINLTFDEQAQGNSGYLASNSWPGWDIVSYDQLKAALPASDALPSTDPSGGHSWYLPEAYARMLGLSSSAPATDETITLNSSYGWSFGQDAINTVEHEISEGAMGRVGGLGDQNGVWSTLDLFRYSAPGVTDFTDGRDGKTTFFSVDGSTLSSLSFNNQYIDDTTRTNYGDTGDFSQADVFGTGYPGETEALSQTDISVMNALGWTSTATPPPPAPTPPPPAPPPPAPPPPAPPPPAPPPPAPPPPPPPPAAHNFQVFDQTTGQTTVEPGQPYPGPVAGITSEFIDITPHNLNIACLTPNVYIHTGDGNDGINVSSRGGNNVLDGEGGSNFLVGGSGNDTFLVNDLYAKVPSWTTMVGFHVGDAATIWGLTPKDFQFAWLDNGGAAGHTGLTLYATSAAKPEIAVTVAGASIADISSHRLAVQFGTVNSLNYMEISHL